MDRFRDAIHALCAGLHMEHCDPHDVVILLPWKQWWDLHCSLERKYGGLMTFDGRGDAPNDFRYMGITFRAKNDQARDQSTKRAA